MYIVYAEGNATVNINNGYYTPNTTVCQVRDNAKCVINGGEFDVKPYEKDGKKQYQFTFNILDADKATASIVTCGGYYHNYDPSNSAGENPVANFVAQGYKSVEIDDTGNFMVVESAAEVLADGLIKNDDVYVVSKPAALNYLATQTITGEVCLSADIDMANGELPWINLSGAVFNGNGHTISNVVTKSTDPTYSNGLFNPYSAGDVVIKNLYLNNTIVR